jgi:hypothetical protein
LKTDAIAGFNNASSVPEGSATISGGYASEQGHGGFNKEGMME